MTLGKRAAQLETVAEPRAANQYTKDASRHDGGKQNDRTAQRIRSITRAPDVVKDAYREGRISQTLAAKLRPKNPTPERAALVAAATLNSITVAVKLFM